MKFKETLLGLIMAFAVSAYSQQPQAFNGTPPFNADATTVNGGSYGGYKPTVGTGLVINIGSGTVYCSTGNIITYAGGTLALTASSTNYIYLNISSSCAPAFNTTAFAAGQLPIAVAITGTSNILLTCNNNGTVTGTGTNACIQDDRTLFVNPVASGSTISLTTTGTSGSATLIGSTLNIPIYQGAISLTTTGTSGASTFSANTLNIPQYQGALTLTTTGTSGASTLSGNTLNIPQYAGGVTSVSNSDGSIIFSPTAGAVVGSIVTSHANSWAATQSFTATLGFDASSALQIKLPVSSGYTSAANGELGYDTTNKNWHLWANGVDSFLASFPVVSPPTSTHCVEFLSTGGVWTLADAGGTCTTGGSGLSGMTTGQVPIAATATTVTSSKALAGSGSGITTGPTSVTNLDCVNFNGTTGQIQDSGAPCGTGSGSTVFCSVNAQSGTTYTLVLADGTSSGSACIGTVTVNNAATNTVTVPPNSSVAFPVPDEIDFIQLGAGQTCIAAGAGVTLTTPTSLCARAINSTFGIRKIATNTWIVFGDTQ